jgi:hypothetical protein
MTDTHIKVPLDTPVQSEGKEISELSLRADVRARDFFAGDGAAGDTERVARIAAHLAADFVRLLGIVGPLLEGGRATPKTSRATSR